MINKLNDDLKEALKTGDKFKLSVLRMLKSALQLESINKKKDLADDEVLNVIKKQVKQRHDSIAEFEKFAKLDKVDSLKNEITILESYLPEEISDEKLTEIIDQVFSEVNPTGMKEMGLVMKKISESLKDLNADMSKVSSMVKERLL